MAPAEALPDKKVLIERILAKLGDELAAIEKSARAAHEAATHEESRAEDSHDTRGIEASYLAGAQAVRAAELQDLISIYKFLPLRDFKAGDPIAPSALIEVEIGGRTARYFFVGRGGGISVQFPGGPVQVITPQAPLGEGLQGRRVGELIEVEVQGALREYTVLSVR